MDTHPLVQSFSWAIWQDQLQPENASSLTQSYNKKGNDIGSDGSQTRAHAILDPFCMLVYLIPTTTWERRHNCYSHFMDGKTGVQRDEHLSQGHTADTCHNQDLICNCLTSKSLPLISPAMLPL